MIFVVLFTLLCPLSSSAHANLTSSNNEETAQIIFTTQNIPYPDFTISDQVLDVDEESRSIELEAIIPELEDEDVTYEFNIDEDETEIEVGEDNEVWLDEGENILTLDPNPKTTEAKKVSIGVEASYEGGQATTYCNFRVRRLEEPDWALSSPRLTVEDQNFQHDEDERTIELDAEARVIGDVDYSDVDYSIDYDYEVVRGSAVAAIDGNQLTLEPEHGEQTVRLKTTAEAKDKESATTTDFVVNKEIPPSDEECVIEDISFDGEEIDLEEEETKTITLDGEGSLEEDCENELIKNYNITNDIEAYIEGDELTVEEVGEVEVELKLIAGATTETVTATFDVIAKPVEEVEEEIQELKEDLGDDPSDQDLEDNEDAINDAEESFHDLENYQKNWVDDDSRETLNDYINSLGRVLEEVDDEKFITRAEAWGLSTSKNLRDIIEDGDDIELRLVVESADNSSSPNQTKKDQALIEEYIEEGEMGTVFNMALVQRIIKENENKIVEEYINETDAYVTITIELPEEDRGNDNYTINHVHTDETGDKTIGDLEPTYYEDDHELEFKIDKFSTFSISYEETEDDETRTPSRSSTRRTRDEDTEDDDTQVDKEM